MPNLLIHSMSEFASIIVEALDRAKARQIVEIGAEFGGMSTILATYAGHAEGHLYSIDPNPKAEFLQWVGGHDNVTHVEKPSLDAFAELRDVDAWLVDGDHNWYTVYNELKAIDAACQRDGKPMFAILHDVCWPAAHRDMYYAPETIPAEFRHDYCMQSGTLPGVSDLLPGRGFRGMGQFGLARHEGGPRNGVKSAVADFLGEADEAGRNFAYAEIPAVFGLGMIIDMDAEWGRDVAELMLPYHDNALIASLEENRLANYLTVLDWQDGFIRHAKAG